MPTDVLNRTDTGSAPPGIDARSGGGDGDGCLGCLGCFGCFGRALLLLLLIPGVVLLVVLLVVVLGSWLLVRAVGRVVWRLGLGRHAQGLQVEGVLRPAFADAGEMPLLSDLLPFDRVWLPLHARTVDEVSKELVERVGSEVPPLTLAEVQTRRGLDLAADGVVVLTATANSPRLAACRTVEPLTATSPRSGRKEPSIRLYFLIVAPDPSLYSAPLASVFRRAGPRLLSARDAHEFRQVVVECQEEFEQRMAQERIERAQTRVGCWVVAVAAAVIALSTMMRAW